MSDEANPFSKPAREENRLGFIADLVFLFCVVWLALWRGEIYGASPGSIWTSWWPALVLIALLAVALAIGLVKRRPHGFFPYPLRWLLLTASLVLPGWIALSLAEGDAPVLNMQAAATELRASAEASRAVAKTPEEQRQAQAAVDTAEATEKLAALLAAAKDRGIELPKKALTELGFDPAAVAELDPATKESLEQAAGLAEMQQSGQPPPPGVSDLLREFGLDNPLLQKALIGALAATLGPILGLSPVLIEAILSALIADGLSFDSVMNVGLALMMSTTKTGKPSVTKFRSNYKLIRQGSEALGKFYEALEARGAPRESEGMKLLRETLQEVNTRPRDEACDKALADVRRGGSAGVLRQEDRLRRTCAHMTWEQIQAEVGGQQ